MCVLKGVKPPVEFGERTRNWTPGHAGKEGPHLEMTVASRGFSILIHFKILEMFSTEFFFLRHASLYGNCTFKGYECKIHQITNS